MTDYGHPITFGLSLIPSVGELTETIELTQAADRAGLDYLAIQPDPLMAATAVESSAWKPASEAAR